MKVSFFGYRSGIALVLTIAFLSGLSAFSVARAAEKLKFAGCGIIRKAFMNDLARAFTQQHGIEVDVKGGGATLGIREAAAGNIHVGGGCRPELPFPEEKNVLRHHVAWDAVVAIVHKDNPVDSLSFEQLQDIITGKLTDWGAIGGPNGIPIIFYAREGKISGVGHMARMLLFFDAEQTFEAKQRYKSSGPLEKAIESNSGLWAIGLSGVSSAKRRKVKILRIDGVYPSKPNILSGDYPALYRPLYLFTSNPPKGLAKQFIEFALSPEGQRVISDAGTVNLAEGGEDLWNLYRLEMGF